MGKIIPIISVIVITILAGLFFYDSSSVDKELLNRTFSVAAVYLVDEEVVESSFAANTQKTAIILLEVLGLQPSFQKTYSGSSFTERTLEQALEKITIHSRFLERMRKEFNN